MARSKSEARRAAILAGATRVIARDGVVATTGAIAKEAEVSNGSLFGYFETKATLLNALYVSLKTEMGTAAVAGLSEEDSPRAQVQHMWTQWLRWATSNPDKRRAVAQLDVADDITAESHQVVRHAQSGIADLLDRCREGGPMHDVPLGFVLTLTVALADATTDAIIREPASADFHSDIAFDAVWRVIAGPTHHL